MPKRQHWSVDHRADEVDDPVGRGHDRRAEPHKPIHANVDTAVPRRI